MLRIKPTKLGNSVYYVGQAMCFLLTGKNSYPCAPIPIREYWLGGCVIEEYEDMAEALPVLAQYANQGLNVEIQAGRFVCVSTCPMYV